LSVSRRCSSGSALLIQSSPFAKRCRRGKRVPSRSRLRHGTRRDWRGQGFFRALTEQQESWALDNGFDEVVVKTKNCFYDMRSTLGHLEFNVVKFEPDAEDNRESKVYLSKQIGLEVLDRHRSRRQVVRSA